MTTINSADHSSPSIPPKKYPLPEKTKPNVGGYNYGSCMAMENDTTKLTKEQKDVSVFYNPTV